MQRLSSLVLLGLLGLLSACGPAGTESATGPTVPDLLDDLTESPAPSEGDDATGTPFSGRVHTLRVVGERPHDASAFTQGLEFHEGRLFESRGLYGQSAMTEIDPSTGAVLSSTPLGEEEFGEGATVVGDRIVQITWQNEIAHVYDRDTLEQTGTHTYVGEGWGICDMPRGSLWMSNGTATLTERDPDTFATLNEVTVTLDGEPVDRINELECVAGTDLVLANVWQTNRILVIDTTDGTAGEVDASAIALPNGRWAEDEDGNADVLNGIAYDPTTDTWLVTGKLWPVMYEVEFDCVEGCDGEAEDVAFHLPYYARRD